MFYNGRNLTRAKQTNNKFRNMIESALVVYTTGQM